MAKRVKVGYDVDGVIAEFTQGFTHIAARMGALDGEWGCADQETWDFNLNPGYEDKVIWQEITSTMNWWMSLEPLVSQEEIDRINKVIDQYDVSFVTSRPDTKGLSVERQTTGWLEGIGINAAKTNVYRGKAGAKGALCNALGITVFMDDHIPNLVDLNDSGIKAVCRPWPYNAEWNGAVSPNAGAFSWTILGGIG